LWLLEKGNLVVAASPSRRPSAEWKGFMEHVDGTTEVVPFRLLLARGLG
jgi:hypothetical protein